MSELDKQKETVHNAINTLFDIAKVQKAEIDELKAKLAKVEIGECVIVPKTITQKISDKLFAEHDLDEDRASYIYEDAIEAAQEK
jgi:hypothetical protein